MVDTPIYTLYRRDAPITSIEAAESLNVTNREKMVLTAISTFPNGCISDDVRNYCARNYNMFSYSGVTARYKSLKEKNLITYLTDIEGNDVKRAGASGRNQRVMVLNLVEHQYELPMSRGSHD